MFKGIWWTGMELQLKVSKEMAMRLKPRQILNRRKAVRLQVNRKKTTSPALVHDLITDCARRHTILVFPIGKHLVCSQQDTENRWECINQVNEPLNKQINEG